ncbi:MAG: HEPN domain-containing protein [Candidatus Omnitrophica bacterium]|nr:HEPN domain-containing protein [Candidatus Omnitrophota bacterium]MDD5352757.1 HEPN domain-containing protein [Candidatus Omnitrophota bacterium]MDD5550356.1 HEPN domain-containing protein [Candidatus Omnitrophota bacterium]
MSKKFHFTNFCFTPLPEFNDRNFANNYKWVNDKILIIKNSEKITKIVNKAREKSDFISGYDFLNEIRPSPYFLARFVKDDEISRHNRNCVKEARQAANDLRLFLQALRLTKAIVSSGRICIYYYDKNTYSMRDRTYVYTPKHTTARVGFDELKQANKIYEKILEANNREPNRLLTSILFFEFAQRKFQVLERYTNATAALESIFNTDAFEVTHQVCERVSLFLGEDHAFLKKMIFRNMKKIYGIRSSLAHGQIIPTKQITSNPFLIEALESYFRITISKIMRDDKLFQLFTVKEGKNTEKIREYFVDLLFERPKFRTASGIEAESVLWCGQAPEQNEKRPRRLA